MPETVLGTNPYVEFTWIPLRLRATMLRNAAHGTAAEQAEQNGQDLEREGIGEIAHNINFSEAMRPKVEI